MDLENEIAEQWKKLKTLSYFKLKKNGKKSQMKTYKIKCPECETTFDCSNEIKKWKTELLEALKFMEKVKELNKEGVGIKNKNFNSIKHAQEGSYQ